MSETSTNIAEIQGIFFECFVGIYVSGLLATFFYAGYKELKSINPNSSVTNELRLSTAVKLGSIVPISSVSGGGTSSSGDYNPDAKATQEAIPVAGARVQKSKMRLCRQIFYRIMRYKTIYLSIIVHLADIVTDYLILIQYVFFAMDEYFHNKDYENINYVGVSIGSILIILSNKILSSYYIWQFTSNPFDILLNFFDFYLFKEILVSHESGNKTDLLQFMQKIEKLYESSPQFLLQSYVLLRSSQNFNIGGQGIYAVQLCDRTPL